MADVVVGAPLGHAGHHRQHRLGAVQGLHPGLLIHAQHHRPLRGVVIEPDHVDDLVHELRVGGELEEVLHMRLELEFLPDPPDRGLAQPAAGGHRGPRPVRGVGRALLQRRDHDVLDLIQQDRGRATRSRLIHQPVQAAGDEPPAPAGHRPRRHPQPRGHLAVGQPVRTGQHDLRPQRQRLGGLRAPRPPGQLLALGVGQHQLGLRPPRPRPSTSPAHRARANRFAPDPTVIVVTPSSAASRRTANRDEPSPSAYSRSCDRSASVNTNSAWSPSPRRSRKPSNIEREFPARHTSVSKSRCLSRLVGARPLSSVRMRR